MILKIYSIGKVKSSFIKEGEEEYLKRLKSSPLKIERIELDAGRVAAGDVEKSQEKESALLMERLKTGDYLVLLDERGTEMSSTAFAHYLEQQMGQSRKAIHFAVGGAYGWHKRIYSRADKVLSLSKMTFPFQMARMLLIEQLYRAHTIISGAPYHKS